MGSISSRNQSIPIETVDPKVSDVVITRARAPPPIRQSTIDKTVTETGAEVGKLRPILRVSEYSFDEDEVPQEDDIDGIQDIEENFDTLSITAKSDHTLQKNLQGLSEKSVTNNTEMKFNNAFGVKVEDVADGNSGWVLRSIPGSHRLDAPLSTLADNNINGIYNSKSPPTKFSWTTTDAEALEADDGINRKDAMDGFDPKKFRSVNKNASREAPVLSRDNSVVLLHPHSVPDYDLSEQQIIDSIERESVS